MKKNKKGESFDPPFFEKNILMEITNTTMVNRVPFIL